MPRRDDAHVKPARFRAGATAATVAATVSATVAAAMVVLLAGCSTAPYPIETETNPPWDLFHAPEPLALDPPLSDQAHPIALCYGGAVNTEEEVRARAEELCRGGRLVQQDETLFWNGCSVLQPTRVVYMCDPPPEDTAEKK